MFEASEFRELVSGRKRGAIPTLLRGALVIPEALFAAAVFTRNRLFDWELRKSVRVAAPVISVGNLTVGGTGKSPFVLWLAQRLQQIGAVPTVLSRGYGAERGSPNDEALELRLRAPDLNHLQSADRVSIARKAISDFKAQVLILDDGFQHRRLGRDLDIVLIDASEPFGFGRILPRGLLREPATALRRAGAIVLTRADQISREERERIHHRVEHLAPQAIWCEANFRPKILLDDCGISHPLSDLRAARVLGFAGIGQPKNFRQTLQNISGQVLEFRSFPDHHRFAHAEIEDLVAQARARSADYLVCTCKDLVKFPPGRFAPVRLRAVLTETEVTFGAEELERKLRAVVKRT